MNSTRRRMLAAIGAGTAVTLLGSSATAAGASDRAIVHPADDAAGVIDALRSVGGEVLLEYEHFDFVVARLPAGVRDELESDTRVDLVEEDALAMATPAADGIDSIDGDDTVRESFGGALGDRIGDGALDGTPIDDIVGGDDGDEDDASCLLHPPQAPSWGWERIGADRAGGDGSGVSLAILDTGIETGHCDLDVAGGRNFTGVDGSDYEDRNGHGTHCAGIAAALDNDVGVVGVAPGVDPYAVKVLADDGTGFHSWIAAGIDWCLSNGIEILSLSLGSGSGSVALDAAIERAHAEGHLLVASAGNEGNDSADSCAAETMTYPATHEDVLAVTAMDRDETLAAYSSVGSAVDLMAPGSNVRSTDVNGSYSYQSGTSMACPFVAGAAALAWTDVGAGPGPNDEVRATLSETAEEVHGTCAEGDGLVNAAGLGTGSGGGGDGDSGSGGSSGGSDGGNGGSGSDGGGSTGSNGIGDGIAGLVDGLFSRLRSWLGRLLDWLSWSFG